jgi:hypothetical protein
MLFEVMRSLTHAFFSRFKIAVFVVLQRINLFSLSICSHASSPVLFGGPSRASSLPRKRRLRGRVIAEGDRVGS